MNLPTVVDGLILQARAMPDAARAADLLARRASTIRRTPVSRWPEGVSAVDVFDAMDRLHLAARRLREAAGLLAA